MDYETSHQNAKHSKDSTALMIFYPHALPLPAPREPAPPSQHSPQNPPDTPPSSPLHVISPIPLPSTYSTSTILPGPGSEPNDSELVLCTHHPNTSPTYCFDCDLSHSPGECDGVFGLSKRSGLWVWFVMKWIRLMVGAKSGRAAGEDSAFVQIAGVREVGYRWVGGREGIWGAVRKR